MLLALVVVAIASKGSIPSGTGGARGPSDALYDILFTLYLLMFVGAAVAIVYLLVLRRRIGEQGGAIVKRRGPVETVLSLLILVGAGSLLARRLATYDRPVPPEPTDAIGRGNPGAPTIGLGGKEYEPEIGVPAIVTAALVLLAVAAWWFSGRARKRARGEFDGEDMLALELAAAVDESLDDLRAEPDPRRAVIAAYARLERVLAAHRLPRRPAEAPLEYLARMLDDLSVSPDAARRLTDLFERAKFSQHAVGTEMKEEAISALETVRDDLLAARALAEEARQAAIASHRERAAT